MSDPYQKIPSHFFLEASACPPDSEILAVRDRLRFYGAQSLDDLGGPLQEKYKIRFENKYFFRMRKYNNDN